MTCAFYFIVYDIVFHLERKINYFIFIFLFIFNALKRRIFRLFKKSLSLLSVISNIFMFSHTLNTQSTKGISFLKKID
jgi:hypothetical protein